MTRRGNEDYGDNQETRKKRRVAIVVLNYNSDDDAKICVELASKQVGADLSIIVVDNASLPQSFERLSSWLLEWRPGAVCGSPEHVTQWANNNPQTARDTGRVFLVRSADNRGYSAGNNIGIGLADVLDVDAVLIANPDVRIENPQYLCLLCEALFADPNNCVAGSRIRGLDGEEQNPLREPSFWEEFMWPRWIFKALFKRMTYVMTFETANPVAVPKVSGSCLMLRMTFLRSVKYLDESVFLYCEEPILSAKVRSVDGRIIYVPTICAVHAHVKAAKESASKRMLLFIASRKHYLKRYSGYRGWQLNALLGSYAVLNAIYKFRTAIRR